ncbi:MAG: MopE-related protein, partial [Myxococcota bacterium]|nr:MopE-related protein [Myxococcota bacterium]
DNDCDGLVDEGYPGVGSVCTVGTGSCQRSGTWLCDAAGLGMTCSVTPTEPGAEICNGLDDDCDGQIDNDLTDVELCATQSGVCAGTTRTCGGFAGWQPCGAANFGDAFEPTELSCDGLDNDCDGQADEDLFAAPCPLQKGVCTGSLTPCQGLAGWGDCGVDEYGLDFQVDEAACDGMDNDCDGLVDEPYPTLGQVCQVGVGSCQVMGTLTCSDNAAGVVCSAEGGASVAEICNGLDDNCDGIPDNDLSDIEACANQAGVCAGSMRICGGAGGYQTCGAAEYGGDYQATEITCDGLDNDCDGDVDNGIAPPPCPLSAGVCAGAQKTCGGADGFLECGSFEYGADYEIEEASCDGLDNDCDGNVDEPFSSLGQVCAVGSGLCTALGTIACNTDGSGVGCSAVPGDGGPEQCNGIDDDCNGATDDDLTDAEPCLLQ